MTITRDKVENCVAVVLAFWYISFIMWFGLTLLANIVSAGDKVCPVEHPMRWEYAIPSRWVACWLVERK